MKINKIRRKSKKCFVCMWLYDCVYIYICASVGGVGDGGEAGTSLVVL